MAPLVPAASVEEVIVRTVGATVIEVATDCVWAGLLLSVMVAVKPNVPVAVGVPEMTPEAGARVSPAGS